jgi:hypothetical protein
MSEVQRALNELAHGFEHLSERERLEREKQLLQLENTMLRLERRLPPAKPPKERS